MELYGPYQISLSSIVVGIEVGLVIFPIHFIIILFFKKSRPSVATMNRIRAKTDWQGDTGIIVNDQDYLFDLEQIQVCSSLKCPSSFFVAGEGLELHPTQNSWGTQVKVGMTSFFGQNATYRLKESLCVMNVTQTYIHALVACSQSTGKHI